MSDCGDYRSSQSIFFQLSPGGCPADSTTPSHTRMVSLASLPSDSTGVPAEGQLRTLPFKKAGRPWGRPEQVQRVG